MHRAQGHCHGGESTYQTKFLVFSSEQIPVTLSAFPNNTVDLLFVLVQWIHSELSPCDWRNTEVTETCAYFGRGEFCVFHCMLYRFVSGSYWKHHVSSLVMTLSNISALLKRSDEVWSRRCFWSCVKIRGTIFVEMFVFPKSSFTICHTVSLFIWAHQGSYSAHTCICPLCFWLPTSWAVLPIFSPYFEPPLPFKNPQFLHSIFTISHC